MQVLRINNYGIQRTQNQQPNCMTGFNKDSVGDTFSFGSKATVLKKAQKAAASQGTEVVTERVWPETRNLLQRAINLLEEEGSIIEESKDGGIVSFDKADKTTGFDYIITAVKDDTDKNWRWNKTTSEIDNYGTKKGGVGYAGGPGYVPEKIARWNAEVQEVLRLLPLNEGKAPQAVSASE